MDNMDRVIVIGGGIVGCHVALKFAQKGHEVFLIEKKSKLGQETSSRNSGVLHAGIYYEQNSLKAMLCVEGNNLSREFFDKYNVNYMLTGKYIIARDAEEESEIERLFKNAGLNGAPVSIVSGKTVRDAVSFIECKCGLFSGTTAIIDTGDYFSVLKALLYKENVQVLCSCTVTNVENGDVETNRGRISADLVINCAGLYADDIARACGLNEYSIIPLKGDYYCTVKLPLKMPVYPPPNKVHHTLGLHLTPTFGKEVLIGPSELASSGKDNYLIETDRSVFTGALESMLSRGIVEGLDIYEAYSGNRPRLYFKDERCEDFIIVHGPGQVIHLLGIESPGLTSAPAIARYVYNMA